MAEGIDEIFYQFFYMGENWILCDDDDNDNNRFINHHYIRITI